MPKVWNDYERAAAWAAFSIAGEERDAEVFRLSSLFDVSEGALRTQARNFASAEGEPAARHSALTHALKTETIKTGVYYKRLAGLVSTTPAQYVEAVRLLSATRGACTAKRKRGNDNRVPDAVPTAELPHNMAFDNFLDQILSGTGAPKCHEDTGILEGAPSTTWIEGVRKHQARWGNKVILQVPCVHEDEGVVCGTPLPTSLDVLVRWVDKVAEWNLKNPKKTPRVVQNRVRCKPCWKLHDKLREMTQRTKGVEGVLTGTLVSDAAKKRRGQRSAQRRVRKEAQERQKLLTQSVKKKDEELVSIETEASTANAARALELLKRIRALGRSSN